MPCWRTRLGDTNRRAAAGCDDSAPLPFHISPAFGHVSGLDQAKGTAQGQACTVEPPCVWVLTCVVVVLQTTDTSRCNAHIAAPTCFYNRPRWDANAHRLGTHGTNRYLLLLLCCSLQIPPHLWAPDGHSSGHTNSVCPISSLHGGIHAACNCRAAPRHGHLASRDTWYCSSFSAINGFSQLGPLYSYISKNNKYFNNTVSPLDAKVKPRTYLLRYKAN